MPIIKPPANKVFTYKVGPSNGGFEGGNEVVNVMVNLDGKKEKFELKPID